MRDNQPVTQKEFVFDSKATLMSTTDENSYITYANDAFIKVSGFTADEIKGQPHNLVRHPDMPKEAFADMWSTLRQGEPWSALVKNRRKNGDHYWVRANAIPVIREGKIKGYMSVRTQPEEDETRDAEKIYRNFREGTAKGHKFHKGLIIRTGWMRWRSLLKTLPLKWRLRIPLLVTLLLSIPVAWLSSINIEKLVIFIPLMTMLLLLVTAWLESQISRPIEQLCRNAKEVASGAMYKVTLLDRVDEVGIISRSISQLGLMFRWLVDDVSGQAINVLKASDALSTGNNDLSQRTDQTASNVQRTAATMHQMVTTVKNNTESASQVKTLAQESRDAAEKGSDVMSSMISMMSAITESSLHISRITNIIDSIAFQTNILALNAAVEAARAGEQGKGFAVVAAEVRNLAQRSANAAKEIKQLVEESVQHVHLGTQLADDSGKTMQEIVERVKNVTLLIAQISEATAEQAGALGEVSHSVEKLDEITHQNATLVQQSADATAKMNHQATQLVDAITVFR